MVTQQMFEILTKQTQKIISKYSERIGACLYCEELVRE